MGMIEVRNITIQFKDKIIFKEYSYTFEPRNIYCIMGKSGCGKSTLIRAIAGIQRLNAGNIFYDGKEIVKPMADIAMMHQSHTNFPWLSCLENVLFPVTCKRPATKEEKERAAEILNIVELYDSKKKLPYQLSGGMNQRLSLGRVIMQNPKVILMDEPLGALDRETRQELQDFILQFNARYKNTILLVTHDMEEARKLGNTLIQLEGVA